jgi:hypothetical protein
VYALLQFTKFLQLYSHYKDTIFLQGLYDFSTFCSKFAVLIVRPPSELGSLAAKIELFDSSSSSIFITSNAYKTTNPCRYQQRFEGRIVKIIDNLMNHICNFCFVVFTKPFFKFCLGLRFNFG